MSLPPQSSELSPTELVWDKLHRRVQREYPKRESKLFQGMKNSWKVLSSTFPQNSVGNNAKNL